MSLGDSGAGSRWGVLLALCMTACGTSSTDDKDASGAPDGTSASGDTGSRSDGSGGDGGTSSGEASGGGSIDSGASGRSDAAGSGGDAAGSDATDGGSAGTGGGDAGIPSTPGALCLKPGSGDHAKAGPYTVVTEDVDLGNNIASNQTSGKFTIFYPQPFEESCPHPIVAWGNGTGVDGSSVYAFFNNNAASWGIVVMASHDRNTGSGAYHKAAIDYLLKANLDPASKFYKKLSTRAGVSGHSQGGMGASVASSHPNCQAEVCVGGAGSVSKKVAFLCETGSEDLAESSCTSAYKAAPGPAFVANWKGGTHTGTETLAGYIQGDKGSLQLMRLYAAWFRCHLADDSAACALFRGAPASCGICKDSGWQELGARNM